MPLKSQNAFVRVITVSFFLAATSCADLSLRQSQMNPSDRVEGGDGSGENSVMLDSQGFPTALSPGIDSCRGFAWEPTIAVDPNNPMTVAIAQGSNLEFSLDGGITFLPVVTVPAPSPAINGGNAWCRGGDPAMAFDSQGRLFISYLVTPSDIVTCPPGVAIGITGREVLVTGYAFDGAIFSPIIGVTWPVRASSLAGFGSPNFNADKNWLAADSNPGSPYADQVYVIWADLSAGEWETRITFATPGGNWGDWSAAFQLTSTDDDDGGDGDGLPDDGVRPWPPHVAVAPNGDVYANTHFQMGFLDTPGRRAPDGESGGIIFWTSNDGGSSFSSPTFPFPQGEADMTWNVQSLAGAIAGAPFWLQGSIQGWILPDPNVAGRVHVVTNDDPNDDPTSGDPADVVIATSNDSGANWNAPVQVDSGPAGTFQVMPTAAIDPITGAIGVTYYDNRQNNTNGNGNFLLDLLATYSTDGGVSWFPEVIVNDNPFNPDNTTSTRFCGPNDSVCPGCTNPGCAVTTRIGEYNGISYGECTGYMVWTDNPLCGSATDILFDLDPEMGGDLTSPVPTCPANTAIGCTESTDPANTGSASVLDNCDLDPSLDFFDVVILGNCGQGGSTLETINRTWNTSDAAGNSNNCAQTITVTDLNAPELTVPSPLSLECNGPGGVAGDDAQIVAWLALAVAVDDCTDETVSNDAPDLFPLGCEAGQETTVNFTATDECSNSSFDSSTVTVTDTTPPEVTCEVDVDSLWSPNHKMIDVGFEFTTDDLCDTNPLGIEITVTSDEDPALEKGSGGGFHCPDAIVQEDDSVLLRAERAGTGDGRVYTITIEATDSCGNVGSCSVPVKVPSNPNPNAVTVDSGQAFDAMTCAAP